MSQSLAQVFAKKKKKKEVEGSSRHFGNFTRIHKRLKSVLCEEEAIVGWGPVSKLQGLEK